MDVCSVALSIAIPRAASMMERRGDGENGEETFVGDVRGRETRAQLEGECTFGYCHDFLGSHMARRNCCVLSGRFAAGPEKTWSFGGVRVTEFGEFCAILSTVEPRETRRDRASK